MLGVPRSTIYGHLNKATVGTRPHAQKTVTPSPPPAEPPPDTDRPVDEHIYAPTSAPRTSRACPSCGHEPTTREEATTQRADLAVTWLYADPNRPGQLLPRRHCRHCQPHHPVVDIACAVCGDGHIPHRRPRHRDDQRRDPTQTRAALVGRRRLATHLLVPAVPRTRPGGAKQALMSPTTSRMWWRASPWAAWPPGWRFCWPPRCFPGWILWGRLRPPAARQVPPEALSPPRW